MNTDCFLAALHAHVAIDDDEEIHRRRISQFVVSNRYDWWKRSTSEGHVTGSTWILNHAATHALLLHHRKLNLWVQPGGHLDDSDAAPAAGAMREAQEETGIRNLIFANTALFDVDIHHIPARAGKHGTEPTHLHYDVRYLIMATDAPVTISDESLDAKWMPLRALAQPSHDRSIARMAEKSLRLKP